MVNWERQASWHEADGSKPSPPQSGKEFPWLYVVSQDPSRADIVETLCGELREAGFHPTVIMRRSGRREIMCGLRRVEEQKCFLKKVLPHYLGRKTREWAQEYLRGLEARKRTKYRRYFNCDEVL